MTTYSAGEHLVELTKELRMAEFKIARLKNLMKLYPDLKISAEEKFSSKYVNSDYDSVNFNRGAFDLSLTVYKTIEFPFGELMATNKVYGIPYCNKILYKTHNDTGDKPFTIHFTKFCNQFKNKKFNPDIVKKAREKIIDYLDKNTDSEIDYTNMDARLRKLMLYR